MIIKVNGETLRNVRSFEIEKHEELGATSAVVIVGASSGYLLYSSIPNPIPFFNFSTICTVLGVATLVAIPLVALYTSKQKENQGNYEKLNL